MSQLSDDPLDQLIPRGHPLKSRALKRIRACMDRVNDKDVEACLSLLTFMVADADFSFYEYIEKTKPEMWNDGTFAGIRTWLEQLKEFAT